jgi:hypothetical protein
MIMTLYGIEKSGVGMSSSNFGVYMRVRDDRNTSDIDSVLSISSARSSKVSMPEESSRPRSASGRCSVYFSMSLVNGIVRTSSDRAGRVSDKWIDVVVGLGGVEGWYEILSRTSPGISAIPQLRLTLNLAIYANLHFANPALDPPWPDLRVYRLSIYVGIVADGDCKDTVHCSGRSDCTLYNNGRRVYRSSWPLAWPNTNMVWRSE